MNNKREAELAQAIFDRMWLAAKFRVQKFSIACLQCCDIPTNKNSFEKRNQAKALKMWDKIVN